MLEKLVENKPDITSITTCRDSCTPQNRNNVISYAAIDCLKRHPHVTSFTIKYSVPGRSWVQEVDNMHSSIEKALKANEIFSPVGLIRVLLQVRQYQPHKLLQMEKTDFRDFQGCSKLYQELPHWVSPKIFTVTFKGIPVPSR
ncbi:hypothetical protein RRG08_029255 [Elysia crispata]|uniref:Uncharacterized protein n=1 Tax=Elysia crispata TaxID=231223 RepID=A0AAE1AJL2_9GAST|nr:hypothetical protein RRG08_029255 [Elysia crispata]